ncbi:MAG: hypothetical protein APR54_03495 [Candidatus Cloacimonas sp. SDB]|nr:MAG: hypothetical protein APR54_03495 [Candidatus Cloacimonas sp. SDB]
MKNIILVFLIFSIFCSLHSQLIITGVIDGPLTGGIPKAVELYVTSDIADLSIYGIGCANNGGGTDGEEFTFPEVTATEGDFIYLATESDSFNSWFGFFPDYIDGSATNVNGDDAIELFQNNIVIDIFGEIDVDGTGEPWEYMDGWAYRVTNTGPDGSTFVLSNWYFSTPNALDGETTNSSAAVPFPTGSYGSEPPNPIIVSTYAVSNSAINVKYNMSITSVVHSDYSLSGTANITFSNATIDGADPTIVHLTGASANMVGDAVLDNIADSENASDYDFYAGIMPVAYTNTVYSGRTTIQNGYNATFQARVSANDAYNNVWIHDAAGAYNGIMVYDSNFDALVSVGDEILLVARRTEFNDLTELEDPLLLSAAAGTHYSAAVIAGSEIAATTAANTNPAEKWEGQLVQIENAQVESYDSGNYLYTCTDDGGSTYFKMGDNVDYHFGSITITVGESYNITGVVDFYAGEYRINPRTQADLEESGSGQLPPPENVVILREGGNITITWDDVTGASSYNIYSDSDPYGSFSTLEDNIPATLTEWSETIPADEKKFYLIKAE